MTDYSKNQSARESDKHNHFLMTPNIIFQLGLNPSQIALYVALKSICGESGYCIKPTRKIAKMVGMSERKAIYILESLCEVNEFLHKPLIVSTPRTTDCGDRDTNLIKIVDIWDENRRYHKFEDIKDFNRGGADFAPPGAKSAPGGANPTPGVVQNLHQGGAGFAEPIVIDSLKKTPINKTAATPTPKAAAVVHKNISIQEEKTHASQIKKFVDKKAQGTSDVDSWNSKWIIPEDVYICLCQEYGSSYVLAQATLMINREENSLKDQRTARPKKTPSVDNPESFIKIACQNNYAKTQVRKM